MRSQAQPNTNWYGVMSMMLLAPIFLLMKAGAYGGWSYVFYGCVIAANFFAVASTFYFRRGWVYLAPWLAVWALAIYLKLSNA